MAPTFLLCYIYSQLKVQAFLEKLSLKRSFMNKTKISPPKKSQLSKVLSKNNKRLSRSLGSEVGKKIKNFPKPKNFK